MQIQQLPTVTNTGLFPKSVKVTYEQPQETYQHIGDIPEAGYGPKLTPGFVACSEQSPQYQAGYRNRPVIESQVKLTPEGKPAIETVTQKLTVPGPKAEALGEVALCTVLGGLAGATPGLLPSILGILAGMVGGGNARDLTEIGAAMFFGGAALGGAVGLGVGLKRGYEIARTPNQLSWQETPIESSKLKGYNVSSQDSRTSFEPVIEKTELGRWMKPVGNFSTNLVD